MWLPAFLVPLLPLGYLIMGVGGRKEQADLCAECHRQDAEHKTYSTLAKTVFQRWQPFLQKPRDRPLIPRPSPPNSTIIGSLTLKACRKPGERQRALGHRMNWHQKGVEPRSPNSEWKPPPSLTLPSAPVLRKVNVTICCLSLRLFAALNEFVSLCVFKAAHSLQTVPW